MDARIEKTIESLKKHNINCIFVDDEQEAKEEILKLIEPGATVGLGGSMSVASLNVVPELEKSRTVYNPYDSDGKIDKSKNQVEIRKNGIFADYFLTSTNSITEDGYLVNTDGAGNRVAAMAFGPKKLILVAGTNKIVKDVDEAFERIKKVAAPQNTKRHNLDMLPCFSGECVNCASKYRICNSSLIIHNSRDPERITIILVNKDLGY
ncbi:lactate utilization protein [Candidatus Undinarchaeota archaeon]